MQKKNWQLLLLGLLISGLAYAQPSPAGLWKTVDDKTGEARSHVEIYQKDGKYYGKIVKLLQSEPGVVCEECSGKRKNQPVLGMVILEGLEAYRDYWKKGTIVDPETGGEYGCSVWFEEGVPEELKVRGTHWTGLYRTQAWHRVK